MRTSEQLEQDAERTRAQISATLNELRGKLTPGHVVDELVEFANDSSGGAFFHNLRRQVVNNPMPVALMGAALAWLAMSSRANGSGSMAGSPLSGGRSGNGHGVAGAVGDAAESAWETADEWRQQARSKTAEMAESTREATGDLFDAGRSAYRSAADAASSTYDAAAETASDAAARVRDAASSAAETAAETYDAAARKARRAGRRIAGSAEQVRDNLAGTGRSVMEFINEQPLVLVGLGIALGAAIGAALPSTETEDELMGEASDVIKREATGLAEEQLEKGKAVAEHAWGQVKDEAERQGLVQSAPQQATEQPHVEGGDIPLTPSGADDVKPERQPS